jgi:roadblock/LC7 domain-containing protein
MEAAILSIMISTCDELKCAALAALLCAQQKRVRTQVRKLSYGTLQGVLKFDMVYALAWRHCGPLYCESCIIGSYEIRVRKGKCYLINVLHTASGCASFERSWSKFTHHW